MLHTLRFALALFLVLVPGVLSAQPRPPGCDSPDHRRFDFWIGEWDVFNPEGKQVGRNRIERVENGCALQENWTGANGVTGRSLNGYAAGEGQWHQFWIGAGGLVMHLAGRFEGKTLTLEGTVQRGAEPPLRQRLTFTKNRTAPCVNFGSSPRTRAPHGRSSSTGATCAPVRHPRNHEDHQGHRKSTRGDSWCASCVA